MAIYREVETSVYCDVCGECIESWRGIRGGVSKEWAKYYARLKGCTTGKKVICKKCRIEKKTKNCSMRKKLGTVGRDEKGACMGVYLKNRNELTEKCKRCIACVSFDWENERKRLSA